MTCHDCNSAGGYQVDYALAELARMRKMQQALIGAGEFDGLVNVEAGGIILNAKLSIRDESFELRLPERYNDPKKYHAQAYWTHFFHGFRTIERRMMPFEDLSASESARLPRQKG